MNEDEAYELWIHAPEADKARAFDVLDKLLRRHGNAIVWNCLSLRAPDIVNDAVFAATRPGSFRGESKFSTYFQAIVTRLCKTRLRQIIRDRAVLVPLEEGTDDDDARPKHADLSLISPISGLEVHEIYQQLEDDVDLQVFDCLLLGMTQTEIATHTGLDLELVKKRRTRLRQRLGARLRPDVFGGDDAAESGGTGTTGEHI